MEKNMTTGMPTKIATAMIVAVVQTMLIGIASASETHHAHLHKHIAAPVVAVSQVEAPAPVHMRYYGGPKSPMWPEAR
jgi:hypothetical protein